MITVEFSCYRLGRKYSGYVRRYSGDTLLLGKRFTVDTLSAAVWVFNAARKWQCDSFEVVAHSTSLKVARIANKESAT